MTVVLGVDLATANARVVALDEHGTLLADEQAPLAPVETPAPGWQQQQPVYLDVVRGLLARICAALGGRAADVVGLCVSGTSGTVVPCDRSGRPVGPAVMYRDVRAGTEVEQLRSVGITASSTSPMARMGWLAAHTDADLLLHTPGVVHAGVIGEVVATDTSHALKAGIDAQACRWDARALAAVGVPADAVPALAHPGTVLGTVSTSVADRLGLPAGVVVVAGMTDGCTAQIAAGGVGLGDSVGVLGTTLVLKAVADHEVTGVGGALYSHLAPDGRWWPGGASNVGAAAVRTEFGGTTRERLTALEAAAAGHGPATVMRYPLLATGERFPLAAAGLTGYTVGTPDGEGDAYRALLEGVAFVERLALDTLRAHGVRPTTHHLTGGASTNALWNRIRATVLGLPVVRARDASSAHGAALLALSACTGRPLNLLLADVRRLTERDLVRPAIEEIAPLEESYQRWRAALGERCSGALAPTPNPDPTGAP